MQSGRKLTLREIDDVIIPQITKNLSKSENQINRVSNIRNILLSTGVITDAIPSIEKFIFDNETNEQKIRNVQAFLQNGKFSNDSKVLEIVKLLHEDVSYTERLEIVLPDLPDDEEVNEALTINIEEFEQILYEYIEGMEENEELIEIFNRNRGDYRSLREQMEFWIQNNGSSDLEEIVQDIPQGEIPNKFRVNKLLNVSYVKSDDNILNILSTHTPYSDIQIYRLTDYLNEEFTNDVSNSVFELLLTSGSDVTELMEAFKGIDKSPDTIIELLEENDESVAEIRKAIEEGVFDYIRKYILAVNNQANTNLLSDKDILYMLSEASKGTYDEKVQSIKGVLQNITLYTDVDDFVNDYIDNMPRKLTNREISDILSYIPYPDAEKSISEASWNSIIYKISKQIEKYKITPKAIPDLKERISRKAHSAIVSSGTPVGARAVSAIGATVTQLTLNSFHTAGSALNMTSGIERIKELTGASNTAKTKSPSDTVFLEQRLHFEDAREALLQNDQNLIKEIGWGFDEVLKKYTDFVHITIKDLFLEDPEISSTDELFENTPRWYKSFSQIYETEIPTSEWYMRLTIDTFKLYKYNLTLEEVSNSIGNDDSINVVLSPISIFTEGKAYIDIFPTDKVEEVVEGSDVSDENNKFLFLSRILQPAFANISIQGIPNIEEIYSTYFGVWEAVESFDRIESRIWRIVIRQRASVFHGVNNTHVGRLCKAVGLNIIDLYEDELTLDVEVPSTFKDECIENIIRKAVSEDNQNASDVQEENIKNKIIPSRRVATEIQNASRLYYMKTIGTNLRDIMVAEHVDGTRTHSNICIQDQRLLGIEAARNRQIVDIYTVLAGGGDLSIDLRHIILLCDFMTYKGTVMGLTHSSIKKLDTGFIDESALNRQMIIANNSALMGEVQNVAGPNVSGPVSASIHVGKIPQIGPAMVKTTSDRGDLRKYVEETENVVYDESSFSNIINHLQRKGEVRTDNVTYAYNNIGDVDDDIWNEDEDDELEEVATVLDYDEPIESFDEQEPVLAPSMTEDQHSVMKNHGIRKCMNSEGGSQEIPFQSSNDTSETVMTLDV